jgi:hypothetical protein
MIEFSGYCILHPTSSKSRKFCLMHPLGAQIPSCVEVCLCISSSEPLLMVCLAPRMWACDRRVPVFDIKSARVAYIPVCEQFCHVGPVCSGLRCGWANCSSTSWCDWDTTIVATSPASSSYLCLIAYMVGKWHAYVASSTATCSFSSSKSSSLSFSSSSSHVECIL